MTQQNDNIDNMPNQEEEIDLLELARKLWDSRRMLIRWGIAGAVIGLIVAFSIPREYTTTIKLAPEANDGKAASGGLGALASMAGISMGTGGGADAVYPQLYPDVVSSVPFVVGLFDVNLVDKEGNATTVRQYLEEDTSAPWWSAIMSLPGTVIGGVKSLFTSDDEVAEGDSINIFHLSPKENDKDFGHHSVVDNAGSCSIGNAGRHHCNATARVCNRISHQQSPSGHGVCPETQ